MRLALFDLDGTLIDSEAGIVNSIEYALGRLGAPSPPRDILRGWIGPPLRATFPLALGDDPVAVERAVDHYRERFSAVGWQEHRVYDGVGDAVDALAACGIQLAVVTSKVDLYAEKIVRSLPFGDRFARVYAAAPGSRDSEKASMIARALADFDVAPGAAAMVGDRHFDIDGAKANAVRAIGVAWGFGSVDELRDAGADAIADQPAHLPDLLAHRA
ncbi:phosphoglycolate phosphatase [Dokdonella fugitiva]|uniref:Phosphoglycolate phosphatase n=1 Tax=Dokdonella fugitiva TaxID=328517 RepID=A0A839F0Y8_9GAMM|nr:HAD hydrolase-like protein [Dokdonella fugitiva]MBA8888603.1 phosphoglycolate phosphatase [Dokdonella fugitiva]